MKSKFVSTYIFFFVFIQTLFLVKLLQIDSNSAIDVSLSFFTTNI